MQFELIRPQVVNNTRLFYRPFFQMDGYKLFGYFKGSVYIGPKEGKKSTPYNSVEMYNALVQLRLYRFFYELNEEYMQLNPQPDIFSGMILKDQLMKTLFDDCNQVSKFIVGRLFRMLAQYETNAQKNPSSVKHTGNQQFWKWAHPLDFVYGLEHLMSYWLPDVIEADGGSCRSVEDYEEELEIIRGQSKADDMEFISAMVRNGFH